MKKVYLVKDLRRSTLTLLLLFGGLAPCRQAWAGNKQVNIQGKLTDVGGNPLANPTVTFRLYTVLTGGVAVWSSTIGVTTSNGLFNVSLKDGSPALDSLAFNVPYYLGMTIAGDPNGELAPRQLLGASAYALGSLGNFNVQGNVTSSGTISASQGIVGTTAGDNAAAGVVGEYKAASITTNTNFPASGVYGDLTAIYLTPGDWDISANLYGEKATNVIDERIGITQNAGNSYAALQIGDNFSAVSGPTANTTVALLIPSYRMSLDAPRFVYLKYASLYSGSTPQAEGRISARRVR